MSPPAVSPPPVAIYYMGGSECMFFTLMLYMSTYNVMAPQSPLVTVPMLSAVARNNRIMNITEKAWLSAQNQSQGTWWQLTDYPTGWGATNSDFTDTFFEALNLALYFASFSSVSSVTATPTTNDSNSHDITLNKGVVIAIGIVPAIGCIFLTSAVFLIMNSRGKQQATTKDEGTLNPL